MKIYKFINLILIFFLYSCSVQNKTTEKINTKINKRYMSSRKSFYGKLNDVEYKEIRATIINELNTEIPEKNAILIHYYQKGSNCCEYAFDEKTAKSQIDDYINYSATISKQYDTTDFFMYSSDCLKKERFENRKNFILDSGFFHNYIFTLQENCRAFFILKPNGEFMKHYDSDYFGEITKFLEAK